MSSSAEERVARLKFDNSQFKRGVTESLSMFGRLKQTLSSGAGKLGGGLFSGLTGGLTKLKGLFGFGKEKQSLSELQNQANKTNFSGMKAGLDGVTQKFSVLKGAAAVALGSIAAKAATSLGGFAKKFTIGPILDGLHEYETNLKSLQTVQNNTDKPFPVVQKALNDLNAYSDKTIYNFAEMARNVGTFSAAGVSLKDSVSSIKGLSNFAALAGSSSEDASRAMYQLSQSIAGGKVNLQDWNSVVNAGMGGKKLQNALLTTAQSMGNLKKGAVSLNKTTGDLKVNGESFRESLSLKPGEKPWLSSKVLVNTLASLDGRFSAASLAADKTAGGLAKYNSKAEIAAQIEKNRNALAKQGVVYTDAQFEQIKKLSDASYDSATKVKTFSQGLGVIAESIGSGWAASFTQILGTLPQAKKTFTAMTNYITNYTNAVGMARNKVLSDWNKMGGRAAGIQVISNVFKGLISVIKPVRDAFRDIFPAKTGAELAAGTKNLAELTSHFKLSKGAAEDLRKTFRGVFAVFHILGQVIGGVVHYFFSLIGLLSGGSGGFLTMTGSIGDALVKLDKFLSKGDKIKKFFDAIINARAAVFGPLIAIIGKLLESFSVLVSDGPKAFLKSLKDLGPFALEQLNKIKDHFLEVFSKLPDIFNGLPAKIASFGGPLAIGISKLLASVTERLKGFGGDIGQIIGAGFSAVGGFLTKAFGKDGEKALSTTKSRIEGVKKSATGLAALGDGIKTAWVGVKAVFGRLGSAFDTAVNKMQEFGSNLKDALKKALNAGTADQAISAFNSALFLGFFLMVKRFFKQFSELTAPFREVGEKVGNVLDQTTKNLKTMQNGVRADILLKIAGAVGILALALLALSTIPVKKLAVALGGIAGLMIGLALAMKIVIGAVESGEEDGFAKTIKKTVLLEGLSAALVGFATAVVILAGAVKIFSTMSLGELAKGLGATAIAMGILIAAAVVLTKTGAGGGLLLASVGLAIMASALVALAGAVKLYSSIDFGTLASGGLKIAALILVLGVALSTFPATAILGAAAILIVAPALVALAGALKLYAALDWKTLLVGMAKLALVMGGLTVAMLLVAPAVPIMVGLSLALLAVGVALLAAGAGMALFAGGLATLAVSGAAGFAALTAGLVSFTGILPQLIRNMGKSFRELGKQIIENAPIWGRAMSVSLKALLTAIRQNIPGFGKLIATLISTGLSIVAKNIGKWTTAGLTIIGRFLAAVAKNVGKIAKPATDLIVKFIGVIANAQARITEAGVKLIIKFINGLANSIRKHAEELGRAGRNLAGALIDGMVSGLTGGSGGRVANAAVNVAKSAFKAAKDFLQIFSPSRLFRKLYERVNDGAVVGLNRTSGKVAAASERVGNNAFEAMKASLSQMSDVGVDFDPTITPILDLTQLTKDANSISGLLPDPNIDGKLLARAADLSSGADRRLAASTDVDPTVINKEYKFEQNNYSPKALSPVETYRGTRNQIALAKEELSKL